jgi:hypothetical protein
VSSSDLSEQERDPEACILPNELEEGCGIDTPDSDGTVQEWDHFTRQVPIAIRGSQEAVPLLRKSLSFSVPPRSYLATPDGPKPDIQKDTPLSTPQPVVVAQHDFGGRSTFGQTVS